MPAEPKEDWRLALSSHANGKLQNDTVSRGMIHRAAHSLHQLLSRETRDFCLETQEVEDLVACLRTILQFWSKGAQLPSNPWSQTCLDLTSVLNLALTNPRTSSEVLSKSSKLVGFTLVRSSLMGEGESLMSLFGSSCALVNSFSDSMLDAVADPNIDKLLLYFSQSVATVCGDKFRSLQMQSSSVIIIQLGECCTTFLWSMAAECSSSDIDVDLIASVRTQLFVSLLNYPSAKVLSRIIEMSTSHMNILIKADKLIQAQSLCAQIGALISNLSEKWNELQDLFVEEDASGRLSIAIAIKICAWHQELRNPVAENNLLQISREKSRLDAKSFLLILCINKCSDSVSPAVKSGWKLLTDIMPVVQALDSKKKSKVIAFKFFSSLHIKTDTSDIEKDILSMLFLMMLDYDEMQQCRSTGETVTFNTVNLFRSVFSANGDIKCISDVNANEDVDADLYSFKVLVLCLKKILLLPVATPQTVSTVAFYLQFSMVTLQHITVNLQWNSILRSSMVDSALKLFSNVLIRAANTTEKSYTTSPQFQNEYSFPFFSVVSDFISALIALFCSSAEETCDEECLSNLPGMFHILGEMLAIILQSCSNLGFADYHVPESLKLLDNAVIVIDIVNIEMCQKRNLSKQYAKSVFAFCSRSRTASQISADNSILEALLNVPRTGSPQWSNEVKKLSHFLANPPLNYFLDCSCRQGAVEHYLHVIKSVAPELLAGQQTIKDKDRDYVDVWVERLSAGLKLLLHETNNNNNNNNMLDFLKLSLRSIFCWSTAAAGQDDNTATTITKLQQILILTGYDDRTNNSLKRCGKSNKKSQAVLPQEDILTLAAKFKTSILLLQWTFSVNSTFLDEMVPSDEGDSGRSGNSCSNTENTSVSPIPGFHVVAAAFRLWGKLLDLSSTGEPALMLLDFFGDTYLLFFFLGMYGKVNDQIQLLILLSENLGEIKNKNDDLYESSFEERERFSHLVCCLKSYMTLWLHFNGLHSKAIQLDQIESEETAWSSAINKYLSQSLDILHVTKNTKTILTVSLAENDDAYKQWTATLEEVFQLCRNEKLFILASLMALMHSKFVLITTGFHEVALKWAKFAIATMKSETAPSPHQSAVSTSSARVTCVDTSPMEMEGMLLIAELHEATGSLDRCVSYLAEAKALSIWSASAIQKSLYSLHAFRIWYRVNAKKIALEINSITSCYNDIYNVCQDPYVDALSAVAAVPLTPKTGMGEIKNFMYEKINDCMSFLVSQMRGVVPAFTNIKANVGRNALELRFLDHQWDISVSGNRAISVTQENALNSPVHTFVHLQPTFHCPMSCNMRFYLQTTLKPCRTASLTTSQPLSTLPIYFSGLSTLNSMEQLKFYIRTKINGKPATQGATFDILRSLRRRFSVDCLTGMLSQLDGTEDSSAVAGKKTSSRINVEAVDADERCLLQSMYAFALGAASCGTSVESSLENKSDLGKDRSSQLSSACVLVERICLGDDEKLRHLMTLLDRSSDSTRRPVVTCFLTLEHSSRQLIIGRKDSTVPFPFVVAVPCYDAIIAHLAEWEQVIEMNASQLSRTKNVTEVHSWTNEAKGAWWRDRDLLDTRILDYMRDMQESLGVWRCLLVPTCQHFSRFPKEMDCDIRNRIGTFVSNVEASGVAVKTKLCKKGAKSANTKQSVEGDDDSSAKTSILMYWMYFFSESGVLTSDEQIEAFFQVLYCFLVGRGAVAEETTIRNFATEIWEILFSFKNNDTNANVSQSNSSDGGEERDPIVAERVEYDNEKERKRLEGLKVPELRKLLKQNQQDISGRKSELVDRMCVFYAEQQAVSSTPSRSPASTAKRVEISSSDRISSGSNHVVLILDELLQRIPFENMPLLRHKEVSRVPGLTVLVNLMLLHAQSQTQQSRNESDSMTTHTCDKLLSLANCWYSIDPDANLLGTRATMTEFIQPYAARWGWTGFVGVKPPASDIKNYHENADLFVYCGHGSGDKLFEKQNRLRKLRCPAAMLWGCSSGALSSNGVHDPMGTSIAYLLGGAPFVIGNLWDVTDKDIDKLSVRCMASIFDEMHEEGKGDEEEEGDEAAAVKCRRGIGVVSISSSLSLSRGVCKLKAAVGFAPVMYGLPVGVDR